MKILKTKKFKGLEIEWFVTTFLLVAGITLWCLLSITPR